MRVIAVDHGEKRIGLAISDSETKIARPQGVLKHSSREADARAVQAKATELGAELIVVGESFDEEGRPKAAGRRAERFAEVLRGMCSIPVVMWDESLSTQDARDARLSAGLKRKSRTAAVDAEAAAMILRSYLERQQETGAEPLTSSEGE